jgi:hypothetical protein
VSVSCIPQAPAIGEQSLPNFGQIGTQDFGFINTNGSAVGQVYQLDLTPSHEIFTNPAGDVADSGHTQTNAPANTTAKVAVDWQINASAQLSSSEQFSVQSALQKTWTLSLQNVSQESIDNTLDRLNNDAANAILKGQILGSPSSIFMVLNPVLEGQSAEISVDQSDNVNVSVKLGWAVTADVTYTCSSDILRQSVSSPSPTATLITFPELVQASADHLSVVHAKGLNFPAPPNVVQVLVGGSPEKQPKPHAYAIVHFCKRSDFDFANSRCKTAAGAAAH